jgi:hypothetical protein
VVTQVLDDRAADPQNQSFCQPAGWVQATGARILIAAEPSRTDGSDSKRGTQVLCDPLLVSQRLELKRERVFGHGLGLDHFVHGGSPQSKEGIAAIRKESAGHHSNSK